MNKNINNSTIFLNNATTEDILSALLDSGILSVGDMQNAVKQKKKQELLKCHHHKIWKGEDGRWRTFLQDETREKNRRLISRATEQALEDYLCEYYDDKIKTEELTMASLFEEWIKYKSSLVDVQSVKHNKNDWQRYYKGEDITLKPMAQIDGLELNAWVHQMIEKHKMTSHMYRNFICIVRQLWNYAYEKEYISKNAWNGVKVEKSKRLYPEKTKKRSEEVFSEEEIRKIIEYCWEYYRKGKSAKQYYIPLALIFAYYTGMRLGEVAALKFEDIDGSICRLHRQLNAEKKETVEHLKQHRIREVILPTKALELIGEAKRDRLARGLSVDDYIFCPNDNVNATYRRLQDYVIDVCDALDIPRRSIHKIRKTTLSALYPHLSLDTICKQAGHSDPKVFFDSYLRDRSPDEQNIATMDAVL